MSVVNYMKSWLYKNRITIIGVLIVGMTHLISMIITRSCIFGDNIYVGGDNQSQLLGYAVEFRRKILEGDMPFYTWHALGGMDFHLPFTLCLTNISMLILSFVPYNYYSDVCDILIVLHSIGMFIAMKYYLVNRESGVRFKNDRPDVLLFAVSYALLPAFYDMAIYNPFLIEFVLMPLAILGLERFVYNKGWKLYFIILALMMINNTYLGLMGCIFIVLYYFTLNFDGVREFVVKSLKIVCISVLAVMTSAFYFIPQLCSSLGGEYGFSAFEGVGFWINWLKEFDSTVWGSPLIFAGTSTDMYWECNLYVSILVGLLLVSYFTIGKYDKVTKIKKAIILIVLVLSLNESMCNYVFHLFHYTHGIPNRHVIFIVFYIITIASDSYLFYSGKTKGRDKLMLIFSSLVIAMFYLVLWVYNGTDSGVRYILCVVIVIAYALLLVFKNKTKFKCTGAVLLVISIIEVSSNSAGITKATSKDIYSNDIFKNISSVIGELDVNGPERMAYNDAALLDNLGMIYNYNSCVGFSNSGSWKYGQDLLKLGIGVSDMAIGEGGYNSFLNSIFAKKYIFKEENDNSKDGVRYISKDDAVFGNSEHKIENGIGIYENNEYINPLMLAEGNVTDYLKYVSENDYSNSNICDYNNKLCFALTGIDKLIKKENLNVKLEKELNCHAEMNDNHLSVKATEKHSENDKIAVIVSFVAPDEGEYTLCGFSNMNLGCYNKGDTIYAYVGVDEYRLSSGRTVESELIVNRLDLDKWQKAYKILNNNQMDIDVFESGHIEGKITSQGEKTVFTTIPYNEGWTIEVDGKEVTKIIGSGFLMFDVDEGNHSVVMSYHSKGAVLGIAISVISVILGIIILFLPIKNSKDERMYNV